MFLGILEVVRFMSERSLIFVVGKNNYVTIITFYCFGSLVELIGVTYCTLETLQKFRASVKAYRIIINL